MARLAWKLVTKTSPVSCNANLPSVRTQNIQKRNHHRHLWVGVVVHILCRSDDDDSSRAIDRWIPRLSCLFVCLFIIYLLFIYLFCSVVDFSVFTFPQSVRSTNLWGGCMSRCFSDYSGFFCRYWGSKTVQGKTDISTDTYMLCVTTAEVQQSIGLLVTSLLLASFFWLVRRRYISRLVGNFVVIG